MGVWQSLTIAEDRRLPRDLTGPEVHPQAGVTRTRTPALSCASVITAGQRRTSSGSKSPSDTQTGIRPIPHGAGEPRADGRFQERCRASSSGRTAPHDGRPHHVRRRDRRRRHGGACRRRAVPGRAHHASSHGPRPAACPFPGSLSRSPPHSGVAARILRCPAGRRLPAAGSLGSPVRCHIKPTRSSGVTSSGASRACPCSRLLIVRTPLAVRST
jgi:hypothetical protein